MQHDIHSSLTIRRIAVKEITLFFTSPIAYVFLATFAAITLFVFFWGESFFARNIADVRPLFEWMPVLLIFLSATLTMRLWSEERRSGTLEYVLTQAVPLWHFVLGKFIACLFLLAVALLVTLPLPVTVAIIGDLDWGPVLAGYIATLLMGAAYLSIGLFVSARSDNQIISLIAASLLSGIFYLIGTPVITDFFGNQAGEWLRLLGMGSRFDAITRGVIDLRDLYFYLSIVLVFLALNTLVLEKERWTTQGQHTHHRQWQFITLLVVANALAGNLWLGQLNKLRVDVTAGQQYSISDATRNYLEQLQEPLLIRGYFSSKTHPLLAPLVPQMRDLIEEYAIAGDGKVRVEFVDPQTDPEAEKEANEKYAIEPVPFQVADRYQAAIVSSYFNVLVQYGDEYQVLGFRDLIEIKARSETDIDVQLRNPEYDLTRAIKKVLNTYQAGGNLFDTVKGKLTFNAYISADARLPKQLAGFRQDVQSVLDDIAGKAGGRLAVDIVDPEANGGKVAEQIQQDYGFQPMTTNLLSDDSFYFYMTLTNGDLIIQIPLGEFSRDEFKRYLDAGIKRFASGFTRTVALVVPADNSAAGMYGQTGPRFSQLETLLGTDLNVSREDLSDGTVSGDADVLLLVAPKELDEKQLFAVDQFLMQGGTLIVATSPYSSTVTNSSLVAQEYHSGLQEWLQHNGLVIEDKLVLDPQNSAYPVPVTRNIGGLQFQELHMLDYPYFIDVRDEGLNHDSLITSELPQVTMAWASPVDVNREKQGQRTITELLSSSKGSWLSSSMEIMPKINSQGISEFVAEGKQSSHLLGVISQGRFDSYFSGKSSPLVDKTMTKAEALKQDLENRDDDELLQLGRVIEHSPESSRIILFSSNDFLRDQVIRLAGSAQQTQYLNSLQLLANTVDWSLEDSGLLSIRSRSHFNRTLPPMEQENRMFWEYLNYALAAFALIVIAFTERVMRSNRQRKYTELLAQSGE